MNPTNLFTKIHALFLYDFSSKNRYNKYIRSEYAWKVGAVVFKIADLVVYGIHGVCKIADIERKKVDRALVEYYVLEPVLQPGTRYYIPTGNATAVSKMNAILSKAELTALLQDPVLREPCWIDDETQRKQYYKQLLCGADRRALIQMVHTLVLRRGSYEASGKKFRQADSDFLKDAQKLLNGEISVVLSMPLNDVQSYMESLFADLK